ncbi:diguanylate cyclase [Massilia sp. R2A-15]|uniref:sensor domain-containing protein n=1 Tax=Massilia sp. R2A-15 TaxID=3064278 RepID=UPI002733A92B|nr:diguanylate cyclase [Massilia sp. R2A-15]WLI90507.1 diguanylate cyclase [Massilia sp. R2A-15]
MKTADFTLSANVLDLLLDAVCAVDMTGRFVFVSAAGERIFGYRPQDMVGMSMIDLVAPEDRARTLARVDEVIAGPADPLFENRYVHKDGHYIDIMWTARWSEADQLRIAVARDVTERKRGERLRAALYAISEAAIAASSLPALFALVHQIVKELLPAPGFTIALYDQQQDLVTLSYHVDEHGVAAAPDMTAAAPLCAHVARSGRPLLLTPQNRDALPEALRAAGATVAPYWLGVPLASGNSTVGAIVVRSLPGAAPYTEQDQALMQFVAAQLDTAVERMQMQHQLQHMARHDALTGLPNRQLFHDRLESALARAGRSAQGFALLYLDLDKFKQVNDRYGHWAGDLLLKEVGVRLQHCVREADTVARLGGDEFVVLLEAVATPQDAEHVTQKILQAFERPVDIGGREVVSRPSIGVAMYPEHGDSVLQLLDYADTAMYAVKQRRAQEQAAAVSGSGPADLTPSSVT